MLRLEPPVELVTPRGRARAVVLLDYGADTDLVWVCFQTDTGECWSWRNRDVRCLPCETFGVAARPAGEAAGGGGGAAATGIAAPPAGGSQPPSQPAAGVVQPPPDGPTAAPAPGAYLRSPVHGRCEQWWVSAEIVQPPPTPDYTGRVAGRNVLWRYNKDTREWDWRDIDESGH